jgi:cystathionine beta-lyase
MHDLTRCVHHPAVSSDGFAGLAVPVHRASTIVYPDAKSFSERKHRGFDGYSYGLHGTPTTRTLEAQLTALHGGVRTVLAPSGQAAVTVVFLSFLLPGDHVLIPDNVYPPMRSFCAGYLKARGIAHEVYDPMIGAGIAGLITERTKLVWIESPGSGAMEVQDVPAIIQAARARSVLVGCDNTWATAVQAAGAWRRFRLRGADQICRRPFRSAARLDHRRRYRPAADDEGDHLLARHRRLAG